ncbi:uncharacterized protein [Palaemon carinicauda]|uniref:uncharacterized protein isoform X2 n=1 Tax=Palaemon carinicauda TaxID=392227 RepID=UPI0035B65D47
MGSLRILIYVSFTAMCISGSFDETNKTHKSLAKEYYFPGFREHATRKEVKDGLRHRRSHLFIHGLRSTKRHRAPDDDAFDGHRFPHPERAGQALGLNPEPIDIQEPLVISNQVRNSVHSFPEEPEERTTDGRPSVMRNRVRTDNGEKLASFSGQESHREAYRKLQEREIDSVTRNRMETQERMDNGHKFASLSGQESPREAYAEPYRKLQKEIDSLTRNRIEGEGRTDNGHKSASFSSQVSPREAYAKAYRKLREREIEMEALKDKAVEFDEEDETSVFDQGEESNDKYDRRLISSGGLCRSMERFLPPDLYILDTCALCYGYIQNRDHFVLKWERTYRQYNNFTISVLFDPSNVSNVVAANVESEALMDSFAGDEGRQKWQSCCQAAKECCQEDMRQALWPSGYCPTTWDGWQCWPSTPPLTEVKRACPSYSYHGKAASCSKMATKQCEGDGRWFRLRRQYEEREWSNYSSCSVAENVILRLYVHIAADCLSTATLLPALFIFFSYKQLRVHRITLHKHLFISLLLEATGNICFRLIQLHRDEIIQQNPTWCITLNLLTKYASLTNYMWYLCEGYYLHKLLASAFAEQNSLIVFYFIGWVFPLVPLSIYTGLRAVRNDRSRCWLVPIDYDWIMYLPSLLALLINIIFLVNIIRILVSKVRATNSNEPSQYRKAVRATMMVVPLFGLQYIVTIYRPPGLGCYWHDFYQIFNNVIDGSTGAVVAIIFCYTNGEVKSLLRRSWERFQERRAPQGSYTAAHSRSFSTVQTTLVDPSPSRRTSSVVSVCINSQVVRRSGSGMRISKRSSLTSSDADGNNQALISPRKSPRRFLPNQNTSGLGSGQNSISKSPQLLEELEDSISGPDEEQNSLQRLNGDNLVYEKSNDVSDNGECSIPLVTFSKKPSAPVVSTGADETYRKKENNED